MPRPASTLLVILLFLLSACQGYDYTINDRVVYSPQPLFDDYAITDVALRRCVEQAIMDGRVTAADQLKALNCSHAGIASTEGISTFQGLMSLKLSDNKIRNLVEVGQLLELRSLYLENNAIIDAVPLAGLPYLTTLELSGNDDLQCPLAGTLARVTTVVLPDHCGATSN